MLVTDNVQQLDDIRPTIEILQNFDFSLDFLLLYWLQHLDNALFVVRYVYSLKDLKKVRGRKWRRYENRRTSEYFPRPTFRTIS